MAYYCLCDCDDYSYSILLLDYLIKIGNLVGLVYFIIQSDFFANLFKSDEKKWTKIVKNNDDYNIVTTDEENEEKEEEQEEQQKGEKEDEEEKQKTD